ncbi:MAG: hypothetical protein J1E98_08200 [Lachnospiraceae bacterium]|nr:hypothetical protein [Lachnospiraceae bacterium]
MNIRIMHILIGIFFLLAGVVTVLDGFYNMRVSNLFIGVAFIVVGCLYFARKREKQ